MEDPRRTVGGHILHKLEDIIIIGLCTLLCNGEDFTDMEAFGELEQHPKILRKVQRSRKRMAALLSLTGVSPSVSSALPCVPCPRFLFSHYFWELL